MSSHEIKCRRQAHFINRLLERIGVTITLEQLLIEITRVDNYENRPIMINGDNGSSLHLLTVNGVECVAVFHWDDMCFVTAYHKKWVKLIDGVYYLTAKLKSKTIRRKNKSITKSFKLGREHKIQLRRIKHEIVKI